jgi:uncharacterized protein
LRACFCSHWFLVAFALAGSLAVADAQEAARATIETTGESSVSAKPDFAAISIGVQSAGKAAQATLADNSRATAALIEALKGAGVEAKDIQTSDFRIWPQTPSNPKNGVEPPVILGYAVSNRVTFTQRDLARLGEVIDKAVAAGGNVIGGVTFGVANASLLLDQARGAALADARRKAEIYAGEAGVKLGGLVELEETGGPAPVYGRAMSVAAAPPIEPGESKLTVGVRARFEIAPAAPSKP